MSDRWNTLGLGSRRLCRNNFENNRCAWEFENIPEIIGNFLTLAKFLDECYMFCGLCILMHVNLKRVKTCLCIFKHAQAISLAYH